MRALVPAAALSLTLIGACGPITLVVPQASSLPTPLATKVPPATPKPSATPVGGVSHPPSSAPCVFPSTQPVLANANMGLYNGVFVPSGYSSEGALTDLIDSLEGASEEVFRCAYPDAYARRERRGQPTPSATPRVPTAPPSHSPSPEIYESAPPSGYHTTITSGMVYDEQGAPVDGALVKVNSLDVTVPYTATTTTASGSWVVNNVPEGANVEILVSKDGWTNRRRVASFQTMSNLKNPINFGSSNGNDPGAGYFISKYPEIEWVRVQRDESWSVTVKLGEGIDDVNRRRLEDGLCVLPANSTAAGSQPLLGDFSQDRAPNGLDLDNAPGAIRKGNSQFGNRVTVTWNADFTEATMTIPLAGLNPAAGARYQVLLASAFTGDRIVDKDNNPLGQTDDLGWQGTIPKGRLIRAVFRNPSLAVGLQSTSGALRWRDTHLDGSSFGFENL